MHVMSDRPAAPREWGCSRCTDTARTAAAQPGTPMHRCRGFSGMTVPFVEAGRRADVQLVPREDYVAGDMVQVDAEGRVWAAARVTRDDGEDVAVYAPCATASGRAG